MYVLACLRVYKVMHLNFASLARRTVGKFFWIHEWSRLRGRSNQSKVCSVESAEIWKLGAVASAASRLLHLSYHHQGTKWICPKGCSRICAVKRTFSKHVWEQPLLPRASCPWKTVTSLALGSFLSFMKYMKYISIFSEILHRGVLGRSKHLLVICTSVDEKSVPFY